MDDREEQARDESILPEPSVPLAGVTLQGTLSGHTYPVTSVAWSPDGKWLASCSNDKTIRLWDATTGALMRILEGHSDSICSVAWSPDSRWLASGSYDGTIRIWNPITDALPNILADHTDCVTSVAWSPDGRWLASGSTDETVRLWQIGVGIKQKVLKSLTNNSSIRHVAWSPDGKWFASGSDDGMVRLWYPTLDVPARSLRGHESKVNSVAWSLDGKWLASGSADKTVRLWNPETGALMRTLEGHTKQINAVVWSTGGWLLLASSSGTHPHYDADISLWRTDTWEQLSVLQGLQGFLHAAWHPSLPVVATVGQRKQDIAVWTLDLSYLFLAEPPQETVHYTNAKVILVGDSGVGKSGLSFVLTGQPFTITESTHGRHVWTFDSQEVPLDEKRKEIRETLLWDLAGQPGYRLIHQLYLNEVALALVVFDAHSETDPFASVQYWDRALRQAQRLQGSTAFPLKKLLVAARIDRGGIGVSSERVRAVVEKLGFTHYFETSAKEGWQIGELREAISRQIPWEGLPKVSSTVLFQQIKSFLAGEKNHARRLISPVEDLYNAFLRSKNAPGETTELPAQFETCIGRVESAGLIKQLSFGNLVLLQPELLDTYASALVNFVRDEPDGLGSITEDQVRAGDFRMPADERIQNTEQEKLLLIAMIEDLLRRELILREEGMLVFPAQSTKEHPDLPDPPGKAVIFEFEGSVLNIYATLAVRLARSSLFKKQDLWKNAVTYTTMSGGIAGMSLRNIGEGRGELTLFFDSTVGEETRRVFEEYVHLHLVRRALPDGLTTYRVLSCNGCDSVIPHETIQRRKARGFDWLTCSVCDTRISLGEREQPLKAEPSSHTQKMDQEADIQRERDAAQVTLQGRNEIGDFDVFLCYDSKDRDDVKQIGEQLKEQGILPWLDEWELQPGLPWQELLEQQIKNIKSAAVFVGEDGVGPWQRQEIAAFLREFVNRGCPVIPALLPGVSQKPELPIFLKAMTWVDFRLTDPDPIQQLIWGITGDRVGKTS